MGRRNEKYELETFILDSADCINNWFKVLDVFTFAFGGATLFYMWVAFCSFLANFMADILNIVLRKDVTLDEIRSLLESLDNEFDCISGIEFDKELSTMMIGK